MAKASEIIFSFLGFVINEIDTVNCNVSNSLTAGIGIEPGGAVRLDDAHDPAPGVQQVLGAVAVSVLHARDVAPGVVGQLLRGATDGQRDPNNIAGLVILVLCDRKVRQYRTRSYFRQTTIHIDTL